jgi:hypothetical protein
LIWSNLRPTRRPQVDRPEINMETVLITFGLQFTALYQVQRRQPIFVYTLLMTFGAKIPNHNSKYDNFKLFCFEFIEAIFRHFLTGVIVLLEKYSINPKLEAGLTFDVFIRFSHKIQDQF